MKPWIKAYTARVTEAEFLNLTDGAVALWYKCNLWVGLNETDGIIPAVEVDRLKGTLSKVKRLLDAGFWEETETEDGKLAYRIVGWCDDQLTAKEAQERRAEGAKRTAKSRKKSGQNSGVSDQNSGVSENFPPKFCSKESSDLEEQSRVTPLEKRREEEIRQERDSARPPGGSLPEAETETRDEGGRQEGTGCQIIRLADLSARTLPRRWSALTKDSETAEAQETASEPKPLEEMTPKELLDYIVTFQWEVNNIRVDGGPAGVDTMRKFQEDYGPERAAQIIRELFVNHQGKYKITKEVEAIGYRHFSQGVRWWIEKIDLKLQSKAKDEAYVESSLKFATDL